MIRVMAIETFVVDLIIEKKYVFSVIHSREAPQNAGSSPYLWSSTCSLMKFDQFSSNFRLQTVAGYRLNRELQCEPFGCVEGSGAECKTCRVQEKRTDDA